MNGKTFSQPLTVKIDPRVKTSAADLKIQHDLSVQSYEGRQQAMGVLNEIKDLKLKIKDLLPNSKAAETDKLKALESKISNLENTPQGNTEPSFSRLESAFSSVYNILHDTDMPPTSQTISAANDNMVKMKTLTAKWNTLKASEEMKSILKR